MKFSTLIRFLTIFAIIVVSLNVSLAQKTDKVPVEQWGVGVALGSIGGVGINGVYALNPEFHLGVLFGFYYQGGSESVNSQTYLEFAPYAKMFVMEPIRNLRPFIMGAFHVSTRTESYKGTFQTDETRTVTSTGLAVMPGAEWFPYSSIGLYGGLTFLALDFDPTIFTIGIGPAFIGIEWFL